MDKVIDTISGHSVTINERKNIVITGVKKIENFDNEEFLLETNMGFINIDMGEMGSQMLDNQSLLAVFYPNPDKDNTRKVRTKSWQIVMNNVYRCNLEVDGSFGPKSQTQANKHYLHKTKFVFYSFIYNFKSQIFIKLFAFFYI